jgi:anti-sigma-K factor RskA
MNRTTPEEENPVTQPKVTPVPHWSHEDLSELFWRHHRLFFATAATAAMFVLMSFAMVGAGEPWLSIVPATASTILSCVATWHRASMRMLGRLRFPPRQVSE